MKTVEAPLLRKMTGKDSALSPRKPEAPRAGYLSGYYDAGGAGYQLERLKSPGKPCSAHLAAFPLTSSSP